MYLFLKKESALYDLTNNELHIFDGDVIVGDEQATVLADSEMTETFVDEFAKALRSKEPIFIWNEDKPFKMTLSGREEAPQDKPSGFDVDLE